MLMQRRLTKTINVSAYKIILMHVYKHLSASARILHRPNIRSVHKGSCLNIAEILDV